MRTSLLGLIFIILLCGCAASDHGQYRVIYKMEDQSNPQQYLNGVNIISIGIVPKLVDIAYFNTVEEGAMEAANDLQVKLYFEGPTTADANEQINIIESMIERDMDVIAVSANDPDSLVPVLMKAKANGIRVITWDADTRSGAREFYVNMVNSETLGRHLVDTLAWNMGESGQFAILTGSLLAANLNEWLTWIQVHQKEYYPDMELVAIRGNDDSSEIAFKQAQEILAEYPELKGIIGNSSVGPPAAAQAVYEAGRSGEVSVVGLSTPNSIRPYIRNGSAQIATLWSPKKLGYLTVVLAKNIHEGKYPYHGQDIANVGHIQVDKDVVIMGEPLDFVLDNIDQYDF